MRKLVTVLALAALAAGCRTLSLNYRQGAAAEMNQKYEEAVQYYQKAALDNPKEPVYRVALVRARTAASLFFLQQARTLVAQNKRKEAEVNYQKALVFDPQNYRAAAELKALTAPPEKPRPGGERIEGPVQLKGAGEPLNLSFRNDVSLRSIFQTLGRVAGVNFLYDDTFRDTNLAIDLTGKDLQQAVNFLCVASKNFSRVIDERTVIIVPDNVQKRMQYELNAIKTFYLSNIDASDVQMRLTQMIKTMYKVPSIQVDKNLNSVTVRDTPQAVALAEKLLRQWDKPKGEVVVDIEIMEVNRTRETNLGIDLSTGALGVQLNPADGSMTEKGFFRLKNADGTRFNFGDLANYQITVPTALASILAADSDTKIIAQPKMRGLAGEKLEYVVGQKVPVINSQFAAYAAGGVANVPITNYTMTDIGITIKMTPKVHLEGEVTLEIELTISSIAAYVNNLIPIIANREIKNTVRLKDGETNLLAGLLRDEERLSAGGITGLKDIPLLGSLFGATKKQVEQTDVVLTITPHIIRAIEVTEEDAKPLWVDPDNLSGVTGAGAAAAAAAGREDLAPPVGAEPPREAGDREASVVYLSPASFEAPREREFRMNVELSSEKGIGNCSLVLTFDPRVLKLKDVLEGGGLRQLGEKVPFLKNISGGTCTIGFSAPPGSAGFKGRGVLAVLVFQSVGPGQSSLGFTSATAGTPMGQAILLETGEASVNIR
ncbi:MAG TPA: secretin N-terminal domain-containing protein [Candidatus Aminicenantes bacterium]|nr:secretin N-terminal domain-containing protein [Candidatus Aminicenantes bacterium]